MNTITTTEHPLENTLIGEYKIVLQPHEDLRDKILRVKKDFSEKYKTSAAITGSCLPLAKFYQFNSREDRLVNRLRLIAMGLPAVKIDLRDFAFVPTHSVNINVASKQQVQYLIKNLREAQALMTLNREYKAFFFHDPSIMIATKLLPWQFEQAEKAFSHKHFSASFIADSICLLKRRSSDQPFRIVHRFDCKNMPVTTQQGALFA
jgi:2'-5' RNA ligase